MATRNEPSGQLVRKLTSYIDYQLEILDDNKSNFGFADLNNFLRHISQRFIEQNGLKAKRGAP